ncbi:nucleoside-diphosphate sugar epimerase [Sporolactobacillus shoreae]|uniref:Nucleoside-diphosphate sugar epimerase n=1 Tax=Sporolactobacillus shoreae TaxID=1465501 RepID=A0A4Z0GQ60_9BACL|nr:nucleoside-diphosphate sugar epimerase [Sporolactobacillus shoreae]TGA98458.1 nucleoside-diphosphate sugar epimerase [Sporolactobacillus shoreae]
MTVSFQFSSFFFEYLVLVFLVMIFSNRYGIYIGLLAFLESVCYTLSKGVFTGQPILPYFYLQTQWFQWLFLLVTAICCGLWSTSQRERYEDLHHNNEELQSENQDLKETVSLLDETRKELKSKILESDNQLSKIYNIYKALSHNHPEIVLDESIRVMKEYLHASKIGIYFVGNSEMTLRLKLSSEHDSEILPQTIFAEHAPEVILKSLKQKKAFFRSRKDPVKAPILAGPVVFQDEVRYLIVLGQIDFDTISSQNFELFVWMLKWMGDRLANASGIYQSSINKRKYEGTNIYLASEFNYLLEIEKKRHEQLNYPYVSFECHLEKYNLAEVDDILKKQLREIIDYVGFDMENQKLMILLPGTDEQYRKAIERRIQKALLGYAEVII